MKRNESPSIVGQSVINRINENPLLASLILAELRKDPDPWIEKKMLIQERYGQQGDELHDFLGKVIGDKELYLSIDISDEAIERAQEDRIRQAGFNLLREEDWADRIDRRNRANELLAMARIAIEQQAALSNNPNDQLPPAS